MGKRHKVPASFHSSFPLPQPLTYKPIQFYALFKRDTMNPKLWIRVSESAYSEKVAYRVFTQRLATAPLSYSIRPVKLESFKAQGRHTNGCTRFKQPGMGNFIKREPGKSELAIKLLASQTEQNSK